MNAFEAFADQHTAAPIKARQRAAAKRAEALERRRQGDTACLREWRRWRREEFAEVLAGPHRERLTALSADLQVRRWDDIDAAVIAAAWSTADRDTQTLVRRVVSAFIMCKRDERRT
jgi:hypothetical protein